MLEIRVQNFCRKVPTLSRIQSAVQTCQSIKPYSAPETLAPLHFPPTPLYPAAAAAAPLRSSRRRSNPQQPPPRSSTPTPSAPTAGEGHVGATPPSAMMTPPSAAMSACPPPHSTMASSPTMPASSLPRPRPDSWLFVLDPGCFFYFCVGS
jgi:hypothetical protein